VLDRLDLQKASAQQALRKLAARAEIERDERGYRLVDPLFGVWIGRLASPPLT
jgi:predicted transcriptional regulator